MEEKLVAALQTLRVAAGWTIAAEAAVLGVNMETLRGVLFRKNRPGQLFLERLTVFADRANPRHTRPQVYFEAQRVGGAAWELLGLPTHKEVLDSLYRRVACDFHDPENLVGFTGIDLDEWQRFAAGAEPSAAFLEAIAKAYSDEVARIAPDDLADADWCRQIPAIATKAAERVLA